MQTHESNSNQYKYYQKSVKISNINENVALDLWFVTYQAMIYFK